MKYLLVLPLVFCITKLYSQNRSIVGTINDTTKNAPIENATIMLLQAKDSVLAAFAISNFEGNFTLKNVIPGNYLILSTFPRYADHVREITIDSTQNNILLTPIIMVSKADLLSEVIVKGYKRKIEINGDTTEFNASSYTVPPNASVESLLKQFSGFQIDSKGKITAHGKVVEKVLVDGEEFFGDDPTLVTRNLRADMIEKVQLYDRANEKDKLSGIDNGDKSTTLNLKLKSDKKNGYFGKAEVGVATSRFYDNQGYFNWFKGKQKLSAYGTYSNIGTTGLGFESQSKLGTLNTSPREYGIVINTDGNNPLDNVWGKFSGQGIPSVQTGGIHYDNKWNQDKQSINSNYKIGSINTAGEITSIQQQFVSPGVVQYNNVNENFYTETFRQKLDAIYSHRIDSFASITLSTNGSLNKNSAENYYNSNTRRQDSTFLNVNSRSLLTETDGKNFNTSLLYEQKFRKARRTFSLEISQSLDQKNGEGYLGSVLTFYDDYNIPDPRQLQEIVDQYKVSSSENSIWGSAIVYTEPLSKSISFLVNYGIVANNNLSQIQSFNKTSVDDYTELDSANSNNYRFDQFAQKTGTNLNFKKGNITLNAGADVAFARFSQNNLSASTSLTRRFVNWFPKANVAFKFKDASLRIYYLGETKLPTIEQLQPVQNNNDLLNVYTGNPNLRPSFNNFMSMVFNKYRRLTDETLYFAFSYSMTSNPIVSNIQTDVAKGKNIHTYFNISGESTNNYTLLSTWSKKWKKYNLDYGAMLNVYGNTFISFNNSAYNRTKTNTITVRPRISKFKQRYSYSLNVGINYTFNKSTLQPAFDNNSFGLNSKGNFSITLPLKFVITAEGNYLWQQETEVLPVFDQLIWNASLQKSFFKMNSLNIKLSCNDILNQNNGFNRLVNPYGISQNTYTVIRRYAMLSVIWIFSKTNSGE